MKQSEKNAFKIWRDEHLYWTEVVNKLDYYVVRQRDKITGERKEVVISKEMFENMIERMPLR